MCVVSVLEIGSLELPPICDKHIIIDFGVALLDIVSRCRG